MVTSPLNVNILKGIDLLSKCGLFQLENPYPKVPEDIASKCRKKDYHEVWKILLEESYFRIQLKDYSFFIFAYQSENNLSMSYYGCPYSFMTIENYIVENIGENNYEPSLIYTYREEYEQALNECPPIKAPVTFRYDYSPNLYKSGTHPASHIHIGHENHIRISCRMILSPLSFIAFSLRHQYPDIWKNKALKSEVKLFSHAIRDKINIVSEEYFQQHDDLEMHLV